MANSNQDARERIARALSPSGPTYATYKRADRVLAVLDDVLTDPHVVVTVHERTTHTIRHVTVILTAAAEALMSEVGE